MRILQLAPRLPYPLTDGGAIGIFKPIEAVAGLGNDITVVTYPQQDSQSTLEGVQKLSKFARVELVTKPLPSRNATLLRTLFSGAYPIERRMMPEMYVLLEHLLRNNKFDIVHLDSSHMGKYGLWIKEKFGLPVILRQHNFETLIYKRFAANTKNPFFKIIASIHAKRMLNEETKFLNHVDGVVAISNEDEQLMQQIVPNARFWVIPAGVDTDYFLPQDIELQENNILWVGGIDWDPNLDAIEFFTKEILPLIVKVVPDVNFDIVGEGTDHLHYLTTSGKARFRLHGRVPDIRPILTNSKVMLCPLRVGGGMRLKLLDFFAAGKAVVSTHIGAEGNLANDGVEILLRDDHRSFAEAVIELLRNEQLRKNLGSNARMLAEKEYSWKSVGRRFCEVYEEVQSKH